jgi:hypothetical protein
MTGVETALHTWRWRKTRYGPLDPAVAARAGVINSRERA